MSGGSIEIRDMVARRGSFSLRVDDLHIEPHEIFAIVGETGAGKTVLLEAIAGAFPLESGSILLDGKDIRRLPVQQRRLGIVYQDHALFPHMTIAENIGYGLRMARVPKAEAARRVEEMLDLFSIRHIADRYPGIISGGEGQRTALALALVLQPEILLLHSTNNTVRATPAISGIIFRKDNHALDGARRNICISRTAISMSSSLPTSPAGST